MTYPNNPGDFNQQTGNNQPTGEAFPNFQQNQGFQQPQAQYMGAPQQAMVPNNTVPPGYTPKNRVLAAVLAFFLGGFGVHNFYLGYTKEATIQLILTIVGVLTSVIIIGFVMLTVVGIWVLVDFICILISNGKFQRDAHGVPLQ